MKFFLCALGFASMCVPPHIAQQTERGHQVYYCDRADPVMLGKPLTAHDNYRYDGGEYIVMQYKSDKPCSRICEPVVDGTGAFQILRVVPDKWVLKKEPTCRSGEAWMAP